MSIPAKACPMQAGRNPEYTIQHWIPDQVRNAFVFQPQWATISFLLFLNLIMTDYLNSSFDLDDPNLVSALDEVHLMVSTLWIKIAGYHKNEEKYQSSGYWLWYRFSHP